MGRVPIRAATELRAALGLARAIETGTFEGAGAFELSRVFDSVITIDLSEHFHARASARFHNYENIQFVLGDSREELARLVQPDLPTLYFLDGHWNAGMTAGVDDQCPVLAELASIAAGHPDDCIVVDDARLYLSSPPPPYDPAQWPTIAELVTAMRAVHQSHHVAVVKDQVYAVPQQAKAIIDRLGHASVRSPVRTMVRKTMGDRLLPGSTLRSLFELQRRRVSATVRAARSKQGENSA